MDNPQLKTLQLAFITEKDIQFFGQEQSELDRLDQESLDEALNAVIKDEIPPFLITQQSRIKLEENGLELQSEPQCNIQDKILTYNRKDKSLMELTRKFIQKFEGSPSTMLVLDQITIEFNVERRRIYDIINIMESLSVVSKVKKNVYEWKGLKKAIQTIELYKKSDWNEQFQKNKRQKSLESLATQFLKLFSQRKSPLTLQQAAQAILSDANDQVKKTKIRRLYDIVNVFKCLGLVEKVKGSKFVGGKPVYEWQGYNYLLKIIKQKDDNARESEGQQYILYSKSEHSSCKEEIQNKEANFKFSKKSNFETNSTFSLKRINSLNFETTSSIFTDISNSQNCKYRCNQMRKNSLNFQPKSLKVLPQLKKQSSFNDAKQQMIQNHIIHHPTETSKNDLIKANGEPSFFQGLFKHLNTSGNDSITEIYAKFTEIMWPSC